MLPKIICSIQLARAALYVIIAIIDDEDLYLNIILYGTFQGQQKYCTLNTLQLYAKSHIATSFQSSHFCSSIFF